MSINRIDLIKLAEELESPNNQTLIAAESDDEVLERVASSLVQAASALRKVAEDMEILETPVNVLSEEKLDEIAAVAESFAATDDELLQKQASTLDDLLVLLASPAANNFMKLSEDDRIEQLKKKYKDGLEEQHRLNRIPEAVAAIEKSPVYKEHRPVQGTLSTRHCPNHPGVGLERVGENKYRCPLDSQEINWEEGYEDLKGKTVPGSAISNQSLFDQPNSFTSFNTREERIKE